MRSGICLVLMQLVPMLVLVPVTLGGMMFLAGGIGPRPAMRPDYATVILTMSGMVAVALLGFAMTAWGSSSPLELCS